MRYQYQPIQRPTNEITWENRREKIADIKVGDRVWVGGGSYPCSRGIVEITRMTSTLLMIGEGKEHWERFRRENGYQVGKVMFSHFISGVATKDEIEMYETEQHRKRKETERQANKQKRIENLTLELRDLFPDGAISIHADENSFFVTFSGMDENDVRDLAKKFPK